MLRRSLILVLAALLVALAFTAGYALLPVRSPEDLLQEATSRIAQGDNLAAAEMLDHSERSPAFAQSADLRRQLWRLRLQALRSLDLPTRALQDIDNLIQDGDQNVNLKMDRVYYLARSGRGDEARQAGLEVVAAHPKLARAMELAGEACKVAYTPTLRTAASRVRADVGFEREKPAVAALLEYLYRPDGDPSVSAADKRLRAFYLSESRLAQAWPQFHDELVALRARIQEATGLFLRALETAGQDPNQRAAFFAAAFQGVAYSLQQAGRNDDLDAQAEIYFSSYGHRWRTDAAAAAAAARYRDGLYESAVDIAERCAPTETFAADFAANRFTHSIRSLLVIRCLSHFRLGQIEALTKVAAAIQKAANKSPTLEALTGLGWGLTLTLQKQGENRTSALQWFCDVTMREPAPQDGEDPLDLLMPLLLDSMAADGRKPQEILARVEAWTTSRPGNALTLLTRGRWQLRFAQEAAAMATATAVLQDRPTDEDALRLLADAADIAYKASQQDGASLLMHCLQRNTDRPDSPPHAVCYLLCAEAALKQQHAWIAKACARLAADRFPWSDWPTMLLARAEAMSGHADAAIEALERILEQRPGSREAVRLCFELRSREGLPVRDLLSRAILAMPDSQLALVALLRSALEDGSPAQGALARKAAADGNATAESLALAARAFARISDPASGRATLARARAASGAAAPAAANELFAAELACLVAESPNADDDRMTAAADAFLSQSPCSGPDAARQLVAAARSLVGAGRPKSASRLLSAALAAGDAIEVRDGASHAFAGDLSLQLGLVAAARDAYTAAVSFEDGAMVAERLARLELLADSPQRAVAALASATSTDDAALAMLLGSAEASRIARERMAKSTEDLLATVPFLLLGGGANEPFGNELRAAPPAAQRDALFACTLLADPQLAATAVARASAAASQAPRCFLVGLLHARAMHAAGDGNGAANVHARLYDEGRRSPLLWAEVSHSTFRGGYKTPTSILAELRATVQKAPTSLRPETLAMLALQSAADAERLGQPDVALGIRADVWRFYPTASRATAADAETLRAAGRTVAAVELLFALQAEARGGQREALVKPLYDTASLVRGDLAPASMAALRAQAAKDLLAGIAAGSAFRFLASDATRMAAEPQDHAIALCRAALLAACRGAAEWSVAHAAVEALRNRVGASGALAQVEEAVALHPATPRLWTERAQLRAQVAERDFGLDDARAVLGFVDDHDFTLELVALAAQLRKSVASDRARFEALPPALRASSDGKLCEGLLALRSGRADQAEAAFAACVGKSETLLHARALANLMRRDPKARAVARTLFDELRAAYPSSSLARNVGSFALQLGPN